MLTAEEAIGAAAAAISASAKVDPRITAGEIILGISCVVQSMHSVDMSEDAANGAAIALVQLVGARHARELVDHVASKGGGKSFS